MPCWMHLVSVPLRQALVAILVMLFSIVLGIGKNQRPVCEDSLPIIYLKSAIVKIVVNNNIKANNIVI